MSKEYIDRNELLELYQDDKLDLTKTCVPVEVVIQNIKDMPAADVAEVVHGEWNSYTIGQFCRNGIFRKCRFYQCVECRYRSVVKTNYCPNCGAKMDGGRKES